MNITLKNFKLLSTENKKEVLHLRNQHYIRSQMSNNELIDYKSHITWINNLDDTSCYLAVFLGPKLIGNLNYTNLDNNKKECIWGCYFNRDVHSFIISVATVKFFELLFNQLKIQKINLFTKNTNLNALSFDKSFGFSEYKKDNDYTYMSITSNSWAKLQNQEPFVTIQKKIHSFKFSLEI